MTADGSSRERAGRIGPYRLVRPIAAGGMGEVFLAHDERLDRAVAIKRVRPEVGGQPERRERFLREARAVARLNHPAVVQVYDIVEAEDGDVIVMEYVEGRTLTALLEEGALDAGGLTEILLQVIDGLQAAHDAGLVHRDLKGENVLVTPRGDAKILDFGIATGASGDPESRLTQEGLSLGTVRAMSPEQAEGARVDARSDLFSLGVLLYEGLTGSSPFLARTSVATLTRVVTHEPDPPRQLNRSVPESLSELTRALLAKRPEDRPASASEVGGALDAIRERGELTGMVLAKLDLKSAASGEASAARKLSGAGRRRARRDRVGDGPPRRARSGSAGRKAWLVVGVTIGAAALVVATAPLWRSAATPTSIERVMVFPLVSGSGVATAVGEDVATMIGHAVDGAEPLTWVDGWSALDAATRADVRMLELDRAAELARAAACAHFVTGRVVAAGPSVRVFLDLRDAVTGERVAGAEAVGPTQEPWRAGLGALSALLPALLPTDVPELGTDFSSVAPEAVARFLRGEAAHRRAAVHESFEHFRAAFGADSSFALAGIRAAQAASWEHDQASARELLEAVLRLPLPRTSEAFARGILAYVRFDAETAVEQLRAALDGDSTLTVAWAALGEVYRHRAPREPWSGSVSPFERALAQDSLAGYVLFHRLEELIRAGDLERARPLLDRFRRGEPDSYLLDQIEAMFVCAERGPGAQDWTAVTQRSPTSVAFAAGQLLMGASNLPCAEALYRAVLVADTSSESSEARYWSGMLGITASKLAQRDFEGARRLVLAASQGFEAYQSLIDRSSVTERGVAFPVDDASWTPRDVPLRSVREGSLTRWSELAIVVSALHPELADLGGLGAEEIRAFGSYEEIPYRTSVWVLGLQEALDGRPDQTALAVDQLRRIAAGYDDPIEAAYTLRMAEALDGHRLLAEGDSASARSRLQGIRANAREGTVYVELIGSFPMERHVLAALDEAAGERERALALLAAFDLPSAVTNALYLPVALMTCVRLAPEVGRMSRAAECRARLEALGWPVPPR